MLEIFQKPIFDYCFICERFLFQNLCRNDFLQFLDGKKLIFFLHLVNLNRFTLFQVLWLFDLAEFINSCSGLLIFLVIFFGHEVEPRYLTFLTFAKNVEKLG